MKPKRFIVFTAILFLILVFVLTIVNLFKLSELDLVRIRTRRAYYPPLFARLYQNKLTEAFNISRKKVFSYLSLDKPLERLSYEK